MYESFFQLSQRPFVAAPQVDRYFPGRIVEAARQTLARCVERAEGAGMLVGPSGSGKTLLLQLLAEHFRQDYAVALLSNGRLSTRRALLQAILFELCLPYRGMEEGELRLSLIDHLAPNPNCPNGMLLLIDEAHSLPLRLLEEVRMITNLVRNGQPRVRLVLSGSPALEERFTSPKLESFSQRITARCYLESFDQAETMAFVQSQISESGADPQSIFTLDALEAVHRATDGVPRLVNQVCDHALMLAYAGGTRQLDAMGIEEAWADLQQLPTPWNESASAGESESDQNVIEFGGLDGAEMDEAPADEVTSFDAAVGHEQETIDLDEQVEAPQPSEPIERLDEISQQMESIEADFEPAGTIGPEAQLAFERRVDPFAEPFAEEEVVIDRYDSLDSPLTLPCAAVDSAEGRIISEMLQPYQCAAEGPRLVLSDGHQSGPDAEVEPAAEDDASAVDEALSLSCHTVEAVDCWQNTSSESDRATHDDPVDERVSPALDPVMPMEPLSEAEEASTEFGSEIPAETDVCEDPSSDVVMIIEDEPPQVVRVDGSGSVPLVRRQEYRQLFANMRRG